MRRVLVGRVEMRWLTAPELDLHKIAERRAASDVGDSASRTAPAFLFLRKKR
jgi:hypothetical protein